MREAEDKKIAVDHANDRQPNNSHSQKNEYEPNLDQPASDVKQEEWVILASEAPTYDKNLCLWWKPNSAGYTIFLDEAGRYTRAEAERHTDPDGTLGMPLLFAMKVARPVVLRLRENLSFMRRFVAEVSR